MMYLAALITPDISIHYTAHTPKMAVYSIWRKIHVRRLIEVIWSQRLENILSMHWKSIKGIRQNHWCCILTNWIILHLLRNCIAWRMIFGAQRWNMNLSNLRINWQAISWSFGLYHMWMHPYRRRQQHQMICFLDFLQSQWQVWWRYFWCWQSSSSLGLLGAVGVVWKYEMNIPRCWFRI